MIDNNNIYYEFNTLKCIHTHLYEKNDYQTTQFNKLILDILEKINHPMLKYINQTEEEIYKSVQLNKPTNNKKWGRKIVSFTQTYGEKRWAEIVLQKYDKIGQYMRNKCDKIIYSFHNCSEETREKGKKYISEIYDKDKVNNF